MSTSQTQRNAFIALFILAVIWSYNWILLKKAVHYIHPIPFVAWRTIFGSLTLMIIVGIKRPSNGIPPWRPTLLLGFGQTFLFNLTATMALMSGAAGKTTVLAYTMPFWTVLLSRMFLGEHLQHLQKWMVGLAAFGMVLVIQPWSLHGSLVSDLWALLSGLVWACSIIYTKRICMKHQIDALSLTAWQMFYGCLFTIALALLYPTPPTQWNETVIISTAFSALFGNALGWTLWMFALRNLPANTVGLNALLVPALAVLFSALQLGEIPHLMDTTGMIMIGIALYGISLKR
ncbi:DMT family transporter [Leeia oryzae]|uniref:DMT family transporter n=1 Tax=Leeia oryzae TaxID=356662 RepID=UPI000372319A|nr:DMT family transporter [Leeia oryzae]